MEHDKRRPVRMPREAAKPRAHPFPTHAESYSPAQRRGDDAQQHLLQLERRYDALARVLGEWTWTTSADGRVKDDIPVGRAFTGQSADGIRDFGWAEAIHPEDRADALKAWAQAIATSTPYENVQRVRRADGEYRTMLVRGQPVMDEGGSVLEWVGVSIDITERQQAEAQLARQARMLEYTHDAIFMWELGGGIVYWNHGAELLYGYSAEEARCQVSHTLLHTVLPLPDSGSFEALIAREGEWTGELIHTTRSGRQVTVLSRHQLLREPDGRMYVLETSHDITKRKQLERRTQESLRALLAVARVVVEPLSADDAAPGQPREHTKEIAHRLSELTCAVLGCRRVGIVAIEPDTRLQRPLAVVGLDPTQEAQWWAEQETNPVSYGQVAHPDLLARFEAGEALVIDMTAPPYADLPNPYGVATSVAAPMRVGSHMIGIIWLDYAGERHYFTREELALCEAVGQLAALAIERERLLHEREAAQASELALREINHRMNTFLAVAGHELRTPVTSMKANIQLASRAARPLQSLPLPEGDAAKVRRLLDLLDVADRQTSKLNRLIEDLLDVTRIQLQSLDLDRANTAIGSVVRDAVEQQRLAWPGRTISLELPDAAIMVNIDAARIGQVVTNFLTNALKYSPDGSPVRVAVSVAKHQMRVAVTDKGPGLSAAQQTQLWQLFSRVEGIRQQSGSGEGLGIGLYICATIIEAHGGHIGVDSKVGKGSAFWFTLPTVGTEEATA